MLCATSWWLSRGGGVFDSTSIKRHIAKGRYGKEELTDGKVLESINGENLYVTRAGEEVYVNGVALLGEAIPAGNSFVYVVPEVMEEKKEPVEVYTTTVQVREIVQGDALEKPLEEVLVAAFKVGRDSLGTYTKGNSLGIWHTDGQGLAVIRHMEQPVLFYVRKTDYSNKYGNYLLAGIGADGQFIYADKNGDGILTREDQYDGEVPYVAGYADGVRESVIQVYMTKDALVPEEPELPDADSLRMEWKKAMSWYMEYNVKAVESKLAGKDATFDYANVAPVADGLWSCAYDVLNRGQRYLSGLWSGREEEYIRLKQDILMDMYLVRTQLYGCFGQLADGARVMPVEELIEGMEELCTVVDESQRYVLYAMLAKTYLIRLDYERALKYCQEVMTSGVYRLEPQIDHEMSPSADSKEVIYGDFQYEGSYIYPLLYREVLLMAACASDWFGRKEEALRYLNELLNGFGYVPADLDSMDEFLRTSVVAFLPGTGQTYPYAKILDFNFGLDSFRSHNGLLPIPQGALKYCPGLVQNVGY